MWFLLVPHATPLHLSSQSCSRPEAAELGTAPSLPLIQKVATKQLAKGYKGAWNSAITQQKVSAGKSGGGGEK